MQSSFDRFFPILLDHEGRTLDTDRRDPGNWTGGVVGVGQLIGTKYGIDAASHWREVDIPTLTEKQAEAIYRRAYAAPIRFDDLLRGVDVTVFDSAVNSGVWRAAKWLQQAVGAEPDGYIGPKTLTAMQAHGAAATINAVCDTRLAFLKGLAIWPVYGAGWTTRMKDLRAYALALAAEH